jgi:hypothetical protein
MFGFLRKLWDLTQPYRGRLLLAILTGVIGGLLEPAMVATIVFVYGLIFPSADSASALLTKKSFRDSRAFVTQVSSQRDLVSQFVWGHFSAEQQKMIADGVAASNQPPVILVQGINHVIQCESLYDPLRFADVALSADSRQLLTNNLEGESGNCTPQAPRLLRTNCAGRRSGHGTWRSRLRSR